MPGLLAWGVAFAVGPAGPLDELPLPSLEPLQARSVEGWDLGRYARTLYEVCDLTGEAIAESSRRLQAIPDPTRSDVRRYFREVDHYLADGEKAARLFPMFDADPGLRDAVAGVFVEFRRLWGTNIDEQLSLFERTEVHNADLARLETLAREFEAGLEQVDARFLAAQVDVAARHHVTLLPPDPPPPQPEPPTFRTPTIPPAGSALDGATHVSFATRYLNRLVEGQNRLVEAVDGALAAGDSVDARERARAEAVKAIGAEVEALRALEDWQGDAAARDAIVAGGVRIGALLDAYAEVLRVEADPRRTQADVDRANAVVAATNEGLHAVEAELQTAMQGFRARWGIDAWQAWEAANPPTVAPPR